MFGFGKKLKHKLSATRFEFTFVVHSLSPWPEGNRAIAVGYQRGKRRRGATRSVYPSKQPGRLGAVVRFNEKFEMPVTLYKASGNAQHGGTALGPFKKKCLILAVLETDGRTQATAALGRVVVDLSEYASVEHQETRTFMVTCNKGIHAAVGDPQLMLTIRCRWNKVATAGGNGAEVGKGGAVEDTASMSTDTTGSRMTANLSSFLRFKFTGKGAANEEQDLHGFESTKSVEPPPPPLPTAKSYMDTIQESHDEPAEPVSLGTPPGSRHMTPMSSMKAITPSSSGMLSTGPQASPTKMFGHRNMDESFQGGPANGSSGASGPLGAGVAGMSLREVYAQRSHVAGLSAGSAGGGSTVGRRDDVTADSVTSSSYGGRGTVGDSATDRQHVCGAQLQEWTFKCKFGCALRWTFRCSSSAPKAGRVAQGHAHAGGLRRRHGRQDASRHALRAALRSAAEAAIYLAQPAASSSGTSSSALSFAYPPHREPKDPARCVHAPARRLARTVLCMGPHDGAAFGASAVRLLRAEVMNAGDSLRNLAFWWSNVVHLRAMLQGLSLAAATGMLTQNGGSGHWASSALVPDLQRLERSIFEELLVRLWDRVLLPTVVGAAGRSASSLAATKRAQQEAAIKKWFEGLEAVSASLARLGNGGHVGLLRQQVLLQCLKRLDALMFYHLLGGAEQRAADVLSEYDPQGLLFGSSTASGSGGGIPHLDEQSLPFAKGGLTFGGGMSVKMTVTRLQQWAAAEATLAGASSSGHHGNNNPGGSGPLFALLRAAADLLMMPKELLLDKAIRLDVCSALSMRSVIHILERFQPDEFAHDSINPTILDSLREESALPLTMRSPAADINSAYRPPADAAVMADVEAGREPGLEYDGDSEDELEGMAQVVASERGASQGSALRFRLLHDLWVAGVPRRRAFTLHTTSR